MGSLNNLYQIISKHELNREKFISSKPRERQDYILKKIIEANHYVKIDELLISRSSVSIKYHASFLPIL